MTAILGVGETAYSRRSGRSVPALAVEAARAALDDAGAQAGRVDGVIPLGGSLVTEDLIAGLRLSESVADATPAPGGNSVVSALGLAEVLIESGRANTVLLVFARNAASSARITERVRQLPGQQFRVQLERPQGFSTPSEWYALMCRRHMIDFGTTKEQLAEIALLASDAAQRNPRAMRHGRPLTLERYRTAPMIADPYQLYDCCLETDGAAALVVSATSARERYGRAPRVLAAASARPPSADDLTNRPDLHAVGLASAAPVAYSRAGLGPADIDAAMIYDCFTFEVIQQLEAAGFCELGEGGPLVTSGALRPDGRLPLNTHGGLLAEAHLCGMGHIIEAVRQLRGEAGERQLDRARHIAVTGWGDLGDGSLAVLEAAGGRA